MVVSGTLLFYSAPVRFYAPGSWGPNAIHQLIAPDAWRLSFERSWRTKERAGTMGTVRTNGAGGRARG